MAQIDYQQTQKAPVAGQLGDSTLKLVGSFTNADTINIPFGIMVDQGAAKDQALSVVAGSTAASFAGVTVLAQAFDPGPNGMLVQTGSNQGLKPSAMLDVLEKGRLFVQVDGAVTVNSHAFVRISTSTTTGASAVLGTLRGDTDSAGGAGATTPTAVKVRGVRFLTAAAQGGLALVEVDMLLAKAISGVTGY